MLRTQGFADRVNAAGDQAFIETLVVRGSADAVPSGFAGIPGAAAYADERTLPIRRGFAEEVIGVVGPASAEEARQLQTMMQAVVSRGTGSVLQGVAEGAKTGTAEYGTQTPLRTHAWMIAYGDDLAVAAFVADGQSGPQTAGPLIAAVLR